MKRAEFVTTNTVINIAHSSPITESSAQDGIDKELLLHSKKHVGHKQKDSRRIEQGSSGKHQCHGSTNGWGDPKTVQTGGESSPAKFLLKTNTMVKIEPIQSGKQMGIVLPLVRLGTTAVMTLIGNQQM